MNFPIESLKGFLLAIIGRFLVLLLLKPQNGQTEALSDAFVPHSGQYTNPISIDLLGAEFTLKPLWILIALSGSYVSGAFGLAHPLLPFAHPFFRKADDSLKLYHLVSIISKTRPLSL